MSQQAKILRVNEAAPTRRPASVVMRPERLAALQPSRISASRAFIVRAAREKWDIKCARFDIDAESVGTAIYRIVTPGGVFSFIAFSHRPEKKGRTGRIIARVWDMMGTLIEGEATPEAVAMAAAELPKLYGGRAGINALVWCRSNRSMRTFDTTLHSLVAGHQPPIEEIASVCYLMRNTGLDGNGTFGTKAFPAYSVDHPLGAPLAAQMLTAFLMREFAADLVNHLAKLANPDAAQLDGRLRRFIGVGNGSALGLILFINKHPRLIHNWIAAREEAIAAAKSLPFANGDANHRHLLALVERAATFRRQDRMMYEAFAPSSLVADDLALIAASLRAMVDTGAHFPLAEFADQIEPTVHPEAFETLLSLMIELVPEVADRRAGRLAASDELPPDAEMTVSTLRGLIAREHGWALAMDMAAEGAHRYVWYKSETAEEPRRGPRDEAPDAINLGLDLPGAIQELDGALASWPVETKLARFLLKHPEHRYIVGRLQGLAGLDYAAPHANIMGDDFIPIHLVRMMNVALHGIDKTRDFLNRNLRGVLYHGAPIADDIRHGVGGDWFYPSEPAR